MRVALVGPKWHEMVNSYPSLGLGYLAAIAEQEGHEAAVFDMGLRPKHRLSPRTCSEIVDWKPDVIAFTSMTTSYQSVEEAVALLKAAPACADHHRRAARDHPARTDPAESAHRLPRLRRGRIRLPRLAAPDGRRRHELGRQQGPLVQGRGRQGRGRRRARADPRPGRAALPGPAPVRPEEVPALRAQRRADDHGADQPGLPLQVLLLLQGHRGPHLPPALAREHRRRAAPPDRQVRRAQLLLHGRPLHDQREAAGSDPRLLHRARTSTCAGAAWRGSTG